MSFTDEEIAYLRSQRLARIATVAPDGQPDASPVGFEFDDGRFYVGGLDLKRTRKFRNVEAGNTKVALVIDDMVSLDPWTPRFMRVYGTADWTERPQGPGGSGSAPFLRITPTLSWSWNLAGRPFGDAEGDFTARRTVHTTA
jgi:pyridoxamine 5'-phosphate oxidase family protein